MFRLRLATVLVAGHVLSAASAAQVDAQEPARAARSAEMSVVPEFQDIVDRVQ